MEKRSGMYWEKSEFDFSAFQDCHEFYTYETREVTMKDLMGSAGEELLKTQQGFEEFLDSEVELSMKVTTTGAELIRL